MKQYTIRQVANGYIVEDAANPGQRPTEHVFPTFARAAAWIKRQMEPVA